MLSYVVLSVGLIMFLYGIISLWKNSKKEHPSEVAQWMGLMVGVIGTFLATTVAPMLMN